MSEEARAKMRDSWAKRKAATTGKALPPREDDPIKTSLIELIAGASVQLAQVSALSVTEIEASLQSPVECDRIAMSLEHLVRQSETLLSLVSHCRRVNEAIRK